ncbi:MAG: helix-turn-helix domain-containing protein [Gemmatimonadales bacterium]|nr:helix-turn-helix domain-containing protein [Gemmatimonadales bacterium]
MLVELKRGRRTARELAACLGVSLNGVRHHLRELEAEGLVAYERETRGVGAPVFVYLLSPAGEARFPRRYKEALEQLLDYVASREGRAGVEAALNSRFDALAERLRPAIEGAPAEERMQVVVSALSDEGYMAEGQASFCCGTLIEHNCAMRDVAERFPEICAAEARFLEAVLGGTVERRTHMLGGCNACEYTVQFPRESA